MKKILIIILTAFAVKGNAQYSGVNFNYADSSLRVVKMGTSGAIVWDKLTPLYKEGMSPQSTYTKVLVYDSATKNYGYRDYIGGGGGGGSAGGSDTYIQLNQGGSFGGFDRFAFDYASNISTLKIKAGSSQSTNDLMQMLDATNAKLAYIKSTGNIFTQSGLTIFNGTNGYGAIIVNDGSNGFVFSNGGAGGSLSMNTGVGGTRTDITESHGSLHFNIADLVNRGGGIKLGNPFAPGYTRMYDGNGASSLYTQIQPYGSLAASWNLVLPPNAGSANQFLQTDGSGNTVWAAVGISASATLDFGSTGSGAVADLTISVTGAALSDVVVLGIPSASVTATATYTAWVSAVNTVTVRFSPKATEDPASGVFKVRVLQ